LRKTCSNSGNLCYSIKAPPLCDSCQRKRCLKCGKLGITGKSFWMLGTWSREEEGGAVRCSGYVNSVGISSLLVLWKSIIVLVVVELWCSMFVIHVVKILT